jgi:hypothetical protein
MPSRRARWRDVPDRRGARAGTPIGRCLAPAVAVALLLHIGRATMSTGSREAKARFLFRVVLYVVVIELWVTGVLCLFAPATAARMWNYPLQDPALVRIVGPPWIVIGLMWAVMAADLNRYRHVIWMPVVGTFLQLGRAIVGWLSGELATEVARPQIISEATFGSLLLFGYLAAYRNRDPERARSGRG